MGGDHYFSSSPASTARPRTIRVVLAGHELEVYTASGVFSPDRVDTGTGVLLSTAPPTPPRGNVLDLGCGWGPIALTAALESPHATIWAVDVNERALELVRTSAAKLRIPNLTAVTPDEVPTDIEFSSIRSNPPIRVGKHELHSMLDRWLPRLIPGSEAWLVVGRNLGADSLHRWLQDELDEGWTVVRAATSKGFRVLRLRRRKDD